VFSTEPNDDGRWNTLLNNPDDGSNLRRLANSPKSLDSPDRPDNTAAMGPRRDYGALSDRSEA